ncbi:hypothetical protein HPULCUR_001437 [Helicostylum pulchrum]|uniref:F-box domain-containing protein n=1 Tax=Helicostylum pulchrum TaxID=562976 RepID=A0ABP9XNQ5_9FUNG
MNKLIRYLFSWIDCLIHIYIHIISTVNAVILVAKRNKGTTTEQKYRTTATASGSVVAASKSTTAAVKPQLIYRHRRRQVVNNKPSNFKKIPNELLMIIFESMEQSDLYHCSTVTKHWNELLTPILWRSAVPNQPILSCLPSFAAVVMDNNKINPHHHLHHHHQKSHIYPGFPLHLSRYGHAVKSLDLSLIAAHVTDCTIRHIVRSCPHLTNLNLSHCRLITNEGLRCLGGNSTNLKVLVLQNCRQITDVGLSYLKESCHTLDSLHVGGCTRITDIGIIALVTASGTTIRRINMSDCSRVTGSSLHAIANICGPRLEWLDIARTKTIRHTDLEYIIRRCPNITRLNVSMKKPKSLHELRNQLSFTTRQFNRLATEEQDLQELIQSTTSITSNNENNPLNELIDLLHQFNIQPTLTDGSLQHQQFLMDQQRSRDPVSNQTVELIALNLKNLQHLNLSHWSCLNDKAVHLLSIHSHCLTYLNLIGCQSVTKKVLRYLSDLCERKSDCITLSDLMISPTSSSSSNKPYYSYEKNCSSWVTNSSFSVSSSSSSEENSPKLSAKPTTTKRHHGIIKSTT